LKIAVIGAGISGLTFAAALRRFAPGIQIELCEHDPNTNGHSRAYGLGLNGDGGLLVLRSLGLYEQLTRHAVTVTKSVVCDQRGRVLVVRAERQLTQRVKRESLEETLRGTVSEAAIQAGMTAKGFRQNDRAVEIQFTSGQTMSADYLVACDGVDSVIRRQLIGDPKHYLQLTTILFGSPQVLKHPLLDGGQFMTLGRNGTSVIYHRQPDGMQLSYTVHAASENEISGLSSEALLRLLQLETRSWHEPIPEIAASLDPANVEVYGCYDKGPLRQIRQGRVWLIGDAAHPMSALQGRGADTAMLDALKLAKFFGELAVNSRNEELKARSVEGEIVRRGREAILRSRRASQRLHTRSHMEQGIRNTGLRISNLLIPRAAKK
jgi:2-polyprenyl-6-methoxyphenol hydroxylase-like FAD-dependent oxidoreductase